MGLERWGLDRGDRTRRSVAKVTCGTRKFNDLTHFEERFGGKMVLKGGGTTVWAKSTDRSDTRTTPSFPSLLGATTHSVTITGGEILKAKTKGQAMIGISSGRMVLYWVILCAFANSAVYAQVESIKFRKVATLVGNGATGPAPTRGMASEVAVSNPFGVQPEADGSLILASFDQHAVYRIDPNYRRVTRIAGTGERGLSGVDGDRPLEIKMNQPHEVQVDGEGNIYIADTMNHRVGMIEGSSGRWRTVAGTGEAGFGGDEGPAHRATINQAYSIAVHGKTLYIADLQNHRIREVDLRSGIIKTVCGTGEKKMPKDGEYARDQPLKGPRSLAVDADNLWIVLREGNSIWRLDRNSGRIFHVAGTGAKGFTGDGGDAKQCTFAGPKGVAVDPGHALFVADTENHAIRRIDLRRGTVTTVIGAEGKKGYNGEGDQVASRQLARPHGVCLLSDGSLLVGDSENHRLRILTK